MPYQIELTNMANRQLRKLSHAIQENIGISIDALICNPRPQGCLKMTGFRDVYRIRERDYRIIYQIKDQKLLVLILEIGHRREVYR